MALFGDIGRIAGGILGAAAPALGGSQTFGGALAGFGSTLLTASAQPVSRAITPSGFPMRVAQEIDVGPGMLPARRGTSTPNLVTLWNALRAMGWRGPLRAVVALIRRHPVAIVMQLLAGFVTEEVLRRAIFEAHTKRHRRMNPANSKALRRASRRIRSFHRLCTQTDLLR